MNTAADMDVDLERELGAIAAGFEPHNDPAWSWAFPDATDREKWQNWPTWSAVGAVRANAWASEGFSPGVAAEWASCEFDYQEAAEWAHLFDWTVADIAPADARWLTDQGIDAKTAAGMKARGYWIESYCAWEKAGRPGAA